MAEILKRILEAHVSPAGLQSSPSVVKLERRQQIVISNVNPKNAFTLLILSLTGCDSNMATVSLTLRKIKFWLTSSPNSGIIKVEP